MSGPAPKEIQVIHRENPNIIHLPTQEARWRKKIAEHVQATPGTEPSFTADQAAPPATGPLPKSPEMEKLGITRIGAEPVIDIEDVKETIGHTVGGTVNEILSGKDAQSHIGTTRGRAPVDIARRKSLKKAA